MIVPVVAKFGGSRSRGWRMKMLKNASRSTEQNTKQVMNALVDLIVPETIKDSPEICEELMSSLFAVTLICLFVCIGVQLC